ncbi:hypothetical protein [Noviherbaspirillum galbum]|uniref:Uncharacterized protein n=1 Tax=Noviherbaspirillum galbum TaxID=2709383 RepID=A0A6B3SY67_9BURK|nr:hypothetical protein [Noviherbaspirillum galbum]NEX64226.1 hypothetical protein [Noviherbaspirillum galbum]
MGLNSLPSDDRLPRAGLAGSGGPHASDVPAGRVPPAQAGAAWQTPFAPAPFPLPASAKDGFGELARPGFEGELLDRLARRGSLAALSDSALQDGLSDVLASLNGPQSAVSAELAARVRDVVQPYLQLQELLNRNRLALIAG